MIFHCYFIAFSHTIDQWIAHAPAVYIIPG